MPLALANEDDNMRRRRHRLRDWLLYVAIALAIVSAAGAFGIHQARTGGSPDLPMKWLGFAGMTGVVFGYAVKETRALRRSLRFKVVLATLFIVHTAVGVFVLFNLSTVPLLSFAVLVPIEFFALMKCLSVV